jgi:hypothetical protein
MKPTGPFLEVVSGEPDVEVEQVLGAARAWAEPSGNNRERVAAALRATLPAALPTALPTALSGPGGLTPVLSPSSWPDGVAPTKASRANAVRRGARLGRAPWLLIGGALLGALGFWLGHGVGYGAGERDTIARAGEALSVPARDALASGVEPARGADELPAQERESSEPPPSRLEPAAVSQRAKALAPRADATTNARAPRPPAARATPAGVEPSGERAEPSRLSFRQVLDQLRRAQQQLRNGQATMSLLLLSELDRSAGDVLLEERNATRVLALCAAGQEDAARDVARRVEHDSPRSIYGMRLEASCITDASPLGGSSQREPRAE